jgi:hypothetical protein
MDGDLRFGQAVLLGAGFTFSVLLREGLWHETHSLENEDCKTTWRRRLHARSVAMQAGMEAPGPGAAQKKPEAE